MRFRATFLGMRTLVLVLPLIVLGCKGELTAGDGTDGSSDGSGGTADSSSTAGGTSGGSAGSGGGTGTGQTTDVTSGQTGGQTTDGTGGVGEGPNLLGNPSFEMWLDGQPSVWDPDATTLTQSTNAIDGEFSLEMDSQSYSSIGQYLTLPEPLTAGMCLRAKASIRWISGDALPPPMILSVVYVGGAEDLLSGQFGWIADGEWHESTAPLIQVPTDVDTIIAAIGGGEADPQAFGIDAVSLRVVDCNP